MPVDKEAAGIRDAVAPAAKSINTTPATPDDSAQPQQMSNVGRTFIIAAIALAVFIGSLDATVVATLVPTVADDFKAVDDVGWYGAVFLLVTGATQPTLAKLYATFRPKILFLISVALLEVGSVICALAKNSPTFIGGRAVAGLGAAGIVSGGLIITALVTPLHLRPAYTGFIGALEGVALIVGPLIGGTITSRIGWRWCFWINLPVGAALCIPLALFWHPPQSAFSSSSSSSADHPQAKILLQKLSEIDVVGGIAITGSLACLFLALQWGGSTYPWRDGRIIALLVVFGVSFICIAVHQRWRGEAATMPTRLLKNKSFLVCLLNGFCIGSAQFVVLYFLPLWFQAVQGASAEESGLHILPLVITVICVALLAGIGVSVTGYLPPFMMAATVLASAGSAVLYTFTTDIPQPRWIGYQILFGSGSGMGIQQAIVGVQAAVDHADVAYATSSIMLGNTLGGALFICVCQNLFLSELTKLAERLPGVTAKALLSGFESVRKQLSAEDLQTALEGYNSGITRAFLVCLVLCCITVLGFPFLPWRNMKDTVRGKNRPIEHAEAAVEKADPAAQSAPTAA